MEPDTLIVRCTSTQNLERLAPAILRALGIRRFDVLTHPGAVRSILEKFPEAGVVPYPFEEDFSAMRALFGQIPAIRPGRYRNLVVPLSNYSGDGYGNVLFLSLLLNPRQIVICDKGGNVRELSKGAVFTRILAEGMLAVPAVILTMGLVLCGCVCASAATVHRLCAKRFSTAKAP